MKRDNGDGTVTLSTWEYGPQRFVLRAVIDNSMRLKVPPEILDWFKTALADLEADVSRLKADGWE